MSVALPYLRTRYKFICGSKVETERRWRRKKNTVGTTFGNLQRSATKGKDIVDVNVERRNSAHALPNKKDLKKNKKDDEDEKNDINKFAFIASCSKMKRSERLI